MLKGKKILIAISGSIAAYKAAIIIRLLIKSGAEVKVIMTPSATKFITPLTLGTLSKNEVLYQLADDSTWSNHVMLGRWADLMLISPLSCNTLSKMASGLCDNLLVAVYLSATCPVVVAPAMDEDMWHHPSTQSNLGKISSFGNHIIPVNNGELASGLTGDGRMAEPDEIMEWITAFFSKRLSLAGKKVLITAGPTHEAIDPVRYIGNASSGKMGIALANELGNRGAEVTLVIGPTSERLPGNLIIRNVVSAEEMYNECISLFPTADWAIMSAAVADYTVTNKEEQKIKKKEDLLTLELKKTKDILSSLGEKKTKEQCLVGFALETNDEKSNALGKLKTKNADLIVLNSLNDEGAGFKLSTNKITIFDRKGGEHHFETKSKSAVAVDIIDAIIKYNND
jgi:phosphopantothenoylcysteine decarboxylase / phosphopantothenate---cysteine ligase